MMTALLIGSCVALAGAWACWFALLVPEMPDLGRDLRGWLESLLKIDQVRIDLRQAGATWLPVWAWLCFRWGFALVAGIVCYLLFGLIVIGVVGSLAGFSVVGMAFEGRRRRRVEERRQALLDAIRLGASMMQRAGSALDMLKALRDGGPIQVQSIFGELMAGIDANKSDMPRALELTRRRVADPLFDDLALALKLHWQRGGTLVPALDAIVEDWSQSLRLQREARALRAGIEASVLILTVLPFVLLFLLHLAAPGLLAPLATLVGEAAVGVAVAWMVVGYRLLQRMSAPPMEERLTLDEAAL